MIVREFAKRKRGVVRPHAQSDVSSSASAAMKLGDSICRPPCAAQSVANNSPRRLITCSNTGTRNATQSRSRSKSVSLGSADREITITAWLGGEIPSSMSDPNCSRVAAIASGANRRTASFHPTGKIRTDARERNHGTRTAVRGAGSIGQENTGKGIRQRIRTITYQGFN